MKTNFVISFFIGMLSINQNPDLLFDIFIKIY